MNDIDRLNELKNTADLFPAMERHMNEMIGHKLFTLMVLDRENDEAARIYSSNPEAYPVKGRKSMGRLSDWGVQVLQKGQVYIGYTADDIRAAFFDHDIIAELGCASVLNLPVFSDGIVIGTMNLLHQENWYRPEHAVRCEPFATLLSPGYLDWMDATQV